MEKIPVALSHFASSTGNSRCADCSGVEADWASLGYGVLICLECAGHHRSLGVHLTMVKSVSMDAWSEEEIRKLLLGGNARLKEYIDEHRDGIDFSSLRAKYLSARLLYYRAMLHAEFTNISVEPYDADIYSDLAAKLSVTAQQLPKSSPEWVPDHFATECMLCRAEFTFAFRRHHCRRCGLCVCRNCAPKENARPILEWNIQQPVRHCKRCFRSPLINWEKLENKPPQSS